MQFSKFVLMFYVVRCCTPLARLWGRIEPETKETTFRNAVEFVQNHPLEECYKFMEECCCKKVLIMFYIEYLVCKRTLIDRPHVELHHTGKRDICLVCDCYRKSFSNGKFDSVDSTRDPQAVMNAMINLEMYILSGGKVKNEETSQKPSEKKCVGYSKEIVRENNSDEEYDNYVGLINTELDEIIKRVEMFMDPVRISRTVDEMEADFDTFKDYRIPTSYMELMLCTMSLREHLSNMAERRLREINGIKLAPLEDAWIAFSSRFKVLTSFLNEDEDMKDFRGSLQDSTIRTHSYKNIDDLGYELTCHVKKYEDLLKKVHSSNPKRYEIINEAFVNEKRREELSEVEKALLTTFDRINKLMIMLEKTTAYLHKAGHLWLRESVRAIDQAEQQEYLNQYIDKYYKIESKKSNDYVATLFMNKLNFRKKIHECLGQSLSKPEDDDLYKKIFSSMPEPKEVKRLIIVTEVQQYMDQVTGNSVNIEVIQRKIDSFHYGLDLLGLLELKLQPNNRITMIKDKNPSSHFLVNFYVNLSHFLVNFYVNLSHFLYGDSLSHFLTDFNANLRWIFNQKYKTRFIKLSYNADLMRIVIYIWLKEAEKFRYLMKIRQQTRQFIGEQYDTNIMRNSMILWNKEIEGLRLQMVAQKCFDLTETLNNIHGLGIKINTNLQEVKNLLKHDETEQSASQLNENLNTIDKVLNQIYLQIHKVEELLDQEIVHFQQNQLMKEYDDIRMGLSDTKKMFELVNGLLMPYLNSLKANQSEDFKELLLWVRFRRNGINKSWCEQYQLKPTNSEEEQIIQELKKGR